MHAPQIPTPSTIRRKSFIYQKQINDFLDKHGSQIRKDENGFENFEDFFSVASAALASTTIEESQEKKEVLQTPAFDKTITYENENFEGCNNADFDLEEVEEHNNSKNEPYINQLDTICMFDADRKVSNKTVDLQNESLIDDSNLKIVKHKSLTRGIENEGMRKTTLAKSVNKTTTKQFAKPVLAEKPNNNVDIVESNINESIHTSFTKHDTIFGIKNLDKKRKNRKSIRVNFNDFDEIEEINEEDDENEAIVLENENEVLDYEDTEIEEYSKDIEYESSDAGLDEVNVEDGAIDIENNEISFGLDDTFIDGKIPKKESNLNKLSKPKKSFKNQRLTLEKRSMPAINSQNYKNCSQELLDIPSLISYNAARNKRAVLLKRKGIKLSYLNLTRNSCMKEDESGFSFSITVIKGKVILEVDEGNILMTRMCTYAVERGKRYVVTGLMAENCMLLGYST